MNLSVSKRRLSLFDMAFAFMIIAGGLFAYKRYANFMDYYEEGILLGTVAAIIWFGRFWPAMRAFLCISALFSLAGIGLYQGSLANGQNVFWLKYILSSQSAVMWMCVLYLLATLMYWLGMLRRSETALDIACSLTWAGSAACSKPRK